MILYVAALILIPVVLVLGTAVLVGEDLLGLFRGGNLLGRLFSDLFHVLFFWLLLAAIWFWALWMFLAKLF
jgi:hypothetical protein